MLNQNIILIDDDEDDTSIFLEALGEISDSLKCETFLDASTALNKLIAKEIRPDIIFLDLNMPRMNGQQFLMEMKKNVALKDIPIIIFSTTAQPSIIQLTKELGGHGFITKPRKYDDLVNLLKPFFC